MPVTPEFEVGDVVTVKQMPGSGYEGNGPIGQVIRILVVDANSLPEYLVSFPINDHSRQFFTENTVGGVGTVRGQLMECELMKAPAKN